MQVIPQEPIKVQIQWEDGRVEDILVPWPVDNSKVVTYNIPEGAIFLKADPSPVVPINTNRPTKYFRKVE